MAIGFDGGGCDDDDGGAAAAASSTTGLPRRMKNADHEEDATHTSGERESLCSGAVWSLFLSCRFLPQAFLFA